jgi:hypothetical protein
MTITNIDKLPPVAQLLARARALILDESHWTQGSLAARGDDTAVTPLSPYALGAVAKEGHTVSPELTPPTAKAAELLDKAAAELFGACAEMDVRACACVNDDHDHEAVIQMFDFAIGEAVKEGL